MIHFDNENKRLLLFGCNERRSSNSRTREFFLLVIDRKRTSRKFCHLLSHNCPLANCGAKFELRVLLPNRLPDSEQNLALMPVMNTFAS